jgi:hypothetical protein
MLRSRRLLSGHTRLFNAVVCETFGDTFGVAVSYFVSVDALPYTYYVVYGTPMHIYSCILIKPYTRRTAIATPPRSLWSTSSTPSAVVDHHCWEEQTQLLRAWERAIQAEPEAASKTPCRALSQARQGGGRADGMAALVRDSLSHV